jgi:hypothetical protein
MCMNSLDVQNLLTRPLAKIELLSRLSPVIESPEAYAHALALLLEMVQDYAGVLRRTLNELANEEGRP